jgi:hypothetical protein
VECDELIPVDEDYFEHCIATLKDLSRIIAEGIEITWSKT